MASVTVTITKYRVNHEFYSAEGTVVTNYNNNITSIHPEIERKAVTEYHVTVLFGAAFTSTPVGTISVFRYVDDANGAKIKQNVLITFPSEDYLTKTGFELDINPSESLSGVILEYSFIE